MSRVLAGRYRLEEKIGQGAQGEIHRATDLLAKAPVAVKLLAHAHDPAHARREVAALRMLRVPGVARLLDEGLDDGTPWLVTELVKGRPFPGTAPDWRSLAGVTVALLETLDAIHAAGVVHRDLKPQNVLVENGMPIVLDFGVALAPLGSTRLTVEGEMVGTPAYFAPEQIRGDRATPRTDLYAVGVMVWEALAGRLPHPSASLADLLRARLREPAPDVRTVAPDVPEHVATVLARLLEIDPRDRPASARETIAMISERPPTATLPALDRAAVLREIEAGLARGERVDLVGPPGAGRSWILKALEERLLVLPAGERPFSSLAALGPIDPDASLDDARALARERLTERLALGPIAVDDEVDAATRRVCGELEGPILLVTSAPRHRVVRVRPFDTTEVRALFAGPDRLHHLASDAARILHHRTAGFPGAIARELERWCREGLATDTDRVVVDRAALERLEASPPAVLGRPIELPDRLDELLFACELAGVKPDLVAPLLGRPAWEIEADLIDLVEKYAVSGTVAIARSRLHDRTTLAERREWHRRIAARLPEGSSERAMHAVAGLDATDDAMVIAFVREAVTHARLLATEGRIHRALALVADAVGLARGREVDKDAFAAWMAIALVEGNPSSIDRVLYEIGTAAPSADLAQLAQLGRAALGLQAWTDKTSEAAEAVPAFDDPVLEARRHAVRVLAARRSSVDRERAVVMSIVDDAPEALRASKDEWLGKLRYREARYEEAAELQEKAAASSSWKTERIARLTHAASAWLECFRPDRAYELGALAVDEAAACRNAFLEGRATWVMRCAQYRRGEDFAPDLDLVNAAAHLGARDLHGLILLGEAAFAHRRRDRESAHRLALESFRVWREMGEPIATLLSGAIVVANGDGLDGETRAELHASACRSDVPGVGLQVVALIPMPVERPAVDRLLALVPEAHRDHRMELLSANEALSLLASR